MNCWLPDGDDGGGGGGDGCWGTVRVNILF